MLKVTVAADPEGVEAVFLPAGERPRSCRCAAVPAIYPSAPVHAGLLEGR